MSRIPKRLLIAHQHTHVRTPRGIGASKLATGAYRLVADHFERVVNLAPVREPGDGELDSIVTYPDNVENKVLYEHIAGQSAARRVWRHLRSIPTIWHEVRDADVVYARMPGYSSLISSLLAVAARKPTMLSMHSDWGEVVRVRNDDRLRYRAFARVADAYQKYLVRRSLLTMMTGEHMRRIGGADAVTISQHQFDIGDLYEREDTCQSRPIRLLLVGVLSERKGIRYLLDALAEVVEEGIDCTLTLVGPKSDYDAEAGIAERGLSERVTLTGHIAWGPRLFELYRASDIFVFPSLSEGSPKAPMEALSQSLPVIATPSGCSDYIEDQVSGLLIPPADAAALATAIRRFVKDDALRRRCIANGFEVARANTRQHMSERIARAVRDAFGITDEWSGELAPAAASESTGDPAVE